MNPLRRRTTGSDAEALAQVHRSGGFATGALGLGIVAVVVVASLRGDGAGPWVHPIALAAALLIWAVMLRPAVEVAPTEVVLHNPMSRVTVPYARIRTVAINQYTRLEVDPPGGGDDAVRLDCSGLGRSRARIRRDAAGPQRPERISVPALMEDRIARRAKEARRLGDDTRPYVVERTWWLIAAVPALIVVGVVWALL